jgi:hypothetical protein
MGPQNCRLNLAFQTFIRDRHQLYRCDLYMNNCPWNLSGVCTSTLPQPVYRQSVATSSDACHTYPCTPANRTYGHVHLPTIKTSSHTPTANLLQRRLKNMSPISVLTTFGTSSSPPARDAVSMKLYLLVHSRYAHSIHHTFYMYITPHPLHKTTTLDL